MNSKSWIVLALPLLLSANLLTGCAGSAKSSSAAVAADPGPITGSSATLIVHGMSCPLCANNVDKQLMAIPGVESVNVDMGSGEVKVALATQPRVTRAQLARAVDASGFTLMEVRTP